MGMHKIEKNQVAGKVKGSICDLFTMGTRFRPRDTRPQPFQLKSLQKLYQPLLAPAATELLEWPLLILNPATLNISLPNPQPHNPCRLWLA